MSTRHSDGSAPAPQARARSSARERLVHPHTEGERADFLPAFTTLPGEWRQGGAPEGRSRSQRREFRGQPGLHASAARLSRRSFSTWCSAAVVSPSDPCLFLPRHGRDSATGKDDSLVRLRRRRRCSRWAPNCPATKNAGARIALTPRFVWVAPKPPPSPISPLPAPGPSGGTRSAHAPRPSPRAD